MVTKSDYDNTNRGVLFRNNKKTTDKHPDYTGNINVGGVEFWLSAWTKHGQRGSFLSLSLSSKDPVAGDGGGDDDMLKPTPVSTDQPKSADASNVDGDDVPF